MTVPKIAVSCVIDRGAQFQLQNSYLLYSLINIQNINPSDIYVNYINGVRSEYLLYLKTLEINLTPINAFDENNRYLNKLSQLNNPAFNDYEFVLLLDNDIFFCESVDLVSILPQNVTAKIVDRPNPPLAALKRIYQFVGITSLITRPTDFPLDDSEVTISNNCNGGFYLFKRSFLTKFSTQWQAIATKLLQNKEIVGEYYSHIDQVSFAIALDLCKIEVEPLNKKFNFPTHLEFYKNLIQEAPLVLHYHRHLDVNQFLKTTGIEKVDCQIQKANTQIRNLHCDRFQNFIFWDYRYQFNPEVGSGIGSTGEHLQQKSNLLRNFSKFFDDMSVLEVGCGDLEVSSTLEFKNYLGIDLSLKSIEIAAAKRPDWKFINTSINTFSENLFNIVICLDVLIHQPTEEDYWQLLKGLILRCGNYLILTGYTEETEYHSDITFYYGSLEKHLKIFPEIVTVEPLLSYRGVTLFACKIFKKFNNYNAYNVSIKQLLWSGETLSKTQLKILKTLIKTSYENFNFFTSHQPRLLEYPWASESLMQLKPNSTLEIGAGVNPIPLYLSDNKINVTTVDSHPLSRRLEDQKNWNEWGFLDYAQFNRQIISLNIDFTQFETTQKFDAIFSISVIEHMPASTRRKMLQKCKQLLYHQGFLILTIDLVPDSEKLWNLSEGKIVEDSNIHGNVQDLLNELTVLNFEVLETKYWRKIPNSRTDVCGIVAKNYLSLLARAWLKFKS